MFIVGIADGLLANTRKESEIKTEGKSIIGLLSMLGVVLSRLCLLVKSRGNQSYLCHNLPLPHVQVRDLTFYGRS